MDKRRIYCAFAGYHNHKKVVAGVALSQDGDILAGVVVPLREGRDLPRKMGIGTTELHHYYIARYGINGFDLEFTWEPGAHNGFQIAQRILLDCHPGYVYDPWNPKPFWADTDRKFLAIERVADENEMRMLFDVGTESSRRRFLY